MRYALLVCLTALAACTPSPIADNATVTFPLLDGTLMSVTESGLGSANYYGSVSTDGTAVTLTGLDADTGSGTANIQLDKQGRPTEVTLGSTVATFTYHEDETFDYVIKKNGEVIFSGANVQPVPSEDTKSTPAMRLFDRAAIEDRINGFLNNHAYTASQILQSSRSVYVRAEDILRCLLTDETAMEAATTRTVLAVVLFERNFLVQQDCVAGRITERTAERVAEATLRAIRTIDSIYGGVLSSIAFETGMSSGRIVDGKWIYIVSGTKQGCLTLDNGYMVREEQPCGQLIRSYPDALTFKDGNRVVIRFQSDKNTAGERGTVTCNLTVKSDYSLNGLATSDIPGSGSLSFVMYREEASSP